MLSMLTSWVTYFPGQQSLVPHSRGIFWSPKEASVVWSWFFGGRGSFVGPKLDLSVEFGDGRVRKLRELAVL